MWGELPVVPRVCNCVLTFGRWPTKGPTRISTHNCGAHDYIVRAFEIPVCIVSCLDRPAQQFPRSRVIRGCHRSWLQGSSPGIRQGELAGSGGTSEGNVRAEGSEREIELLRQVFQDMSIVLLDCGNGAANPT
jgi:hypothetical protein